MNLSKKLFGLITVLTVIISGASQAKGTSNKNKPTEANKYEIKNIVEQGEIGDGYTACSWTNNKNIILTKKGFTGLYLYDRTTNTKQTISDAMSAGYQYQQIDNGNQLILKYAIVNNKEGKRKEGVKVFNLNTLNIESDQLFDQSRIYIPSVSLKKTNAIKVRVKNKMKGIEVESISDAVNKKTAPGFWDKYPLVYTDEGLRLFKDDEVVEISDVYGIDAVISPDGKLMCFNNRGILKIRDENQKERSIGAGLNASWLPNSAAVIYQITEDDGQQVTNSEIYLYDLNLNKTFQLTNTADLLEEYPSVSKDGKQLLFTDTDRGILFTGDLLTK